MKFMGNTITEYYTILGEERGEARGIKLGEERGIKLGEARGKISVFEQVLADGMIDQNYYEKATAPLRELLAKLEKQPGPAQRKHATAGITT